MSLTITTQQELEYHLRQLGLGVGGNVIVHSTLTSFGIIAGGANTVYRALRNVIGNEATVVVPTYMLGTPPDKPFNPACSPSVACGSFSEYVRKLDGAVRSLCPLHNHSAIGPKADLLRDVDGNTSIGPGSDFEVLHNSGFSTLLLGCPFADGATFVIHLEAVAEVPFRKWVEIVRDFVLPDGTITNRKCKYFVRNGDDVIEDLSPIRELLLQSGYLKCKKLRHAESCLISPKGYDVALSALRNNPRQTLI